jgi:glutamyl endopeptidase
MIAKFPKKKRKNQKGVESNKELVTNGTAAFIGENLLITAAHNVFLKEFNEMAVEIYFLPEMLNNSGRVIMIPA